MLSQKEDVRVRESRLSDIKLKEILSPDFIISYAHKCQVQQVISCLLIYLMKEIKIRSSSGQLMQDTPLYFRLNLSLF